MSWACQGLIRLRKVLTGDRGRAGGLAPDRWPIGALEPPAPVAADTALMTVQQRLHDAQLDRHARKSRGVPSRQAQPVFSRQGVGARSWCNGGRRSDPHHQRGSHLGEVRPRHWGVTPMGIPGLLGRLSGSAFTLFSGLSATRWCGSEQCGLRRKVNCASSCGWRPWSARFRFLVPAWLWP